MRFWLILLQLAVICLLISVIGMAGELATSAGKPAGVAVAEGVGIAALILALEAALTFMITGAMATSAAVSIAAALQPIFIFAFVCFACAVLAGYKRLWWVRWVGFILNLGIGLLFLVGMGKDDLLMGVLASSYFLTQAVLFFLVPPKGDAERIRKSATLLHPILGVIGLGVGIFLSIRLEYGIVTSIFAIVFYAASLFIHYKIVKDIQLQPKPLVKAVLILAVTLLVSIVLLFIRPFMAGLLLLSWLSVPLYIETLALFKFRADVPYEGWKLQLRKTIKVAIIIIALVTVLVGGMAVYNWHVTPKQQTSIESLKGKAASEETQDRVE
ncbi:MAG: hypothetical protein DELT_01921 [Desulfovibrio sp.]